MSLNKSAVDDAQYYGESHYEYAGFIIRLLAQAVDVCLLVVFLIPIFFFLYAISDRFSSFQLSWVDIVIVISMVFVAWLITLSFCVYKSSTPGKMLFGLKIVDVKTNKPPSLGQYIVRYAAYLVSFSLCLLGFLWIIIDKRKQGLHDKIAGTSVVKNDIDDME